MEHIATSLGSDPDHLVEALGEVFCLPQPTEKQETPGTGVSLTNTVL